MSEEPSPQAVETVAAMRRQFVAEALDGMVFQAEGAIRFLERGDDKCAALAMKRLFLFAKEAASQMNELRAPASKAA